METYLTRVTDYLLAQSWQIALLVVVIAVVSLVLRNKSAHVRYLLWLIVLAKCLVPPLLTVPVAILPQEKAAVVFEVVGTTISEPLKLPLDPAETASVPIVRERPTKFNIHEWLGAVWIVGAITFLIFNLLKAVRTNYWLWRKRKALPIKLQSGIENLFSRLGLKTFPKVWLIDGIGQPFVWGLLRGSIYLPADFVKVNSAEHRRGVLGHELSHVIRFDAAVNFLQVIAQAIFWFHPFVWWANRKIRAEREKCCDEMAVARLNASPKDYSKAILEILAAKHEQTRPVPSLAVAGPVKNIEERIRTMLKPGKKFYKRPSLIAATVVLLLALLTVPTALVLTARAETKTTTEREAKPAKSLHQAAAGGDIEQVKLLISKGADVNAKDTAHWTPLECAAKYGHKDVAQVLIANGADVNPRDTDDASLLRLAQWYGHADMAKLLLANGADVNRKDKLGRTPLHWAAWHGYKDIVELMIAKGADVYAKDKHGETAADFAIWGRGRNAKEVVELLMAKGASVSRLQGIYLAAFLGDLSKVKSYIKDGKDVNVRDKNGKTLLHVAAMAGRKEVLQFLIANGADVNTKDNGTPLHHAAYHGHKDIAKLLLDRGADVNAKDKAGSMPLHSAVVPGRRDIIELLLANGADINTADNKGQTPLGYAAFDACMDIAKLLITKGADINANENNWTALHSAAQMWNKDMAKLLISKGANVNAKDGDGFTPLHWAAVQGGADVAELLIEKGANLNVKNNEGKSALALAKENGHTEIVELLLKHGAKD